MPSVMMLGGGAFGRSLGHESRTLTNEISALTEEVPESFLAASPREDCEKLAVCNPEEGLDAGTLIFHFQPLES